MVKAITAVTLAEAARPCLNPANVLWPEWPGDGVEAMKTARTRREEKPITILNKNWRPTWKE